MPRDPALAGPGDRERLGHMLDAARDAVAFIESRRREDLDTDAMLRRALVNALQVIGEAAARVPDEVCRNHPGIPWHEVRGMRNFVIHEYFGVDLGAVWDTATKDLPALKMQIREIAGRSLYDSEK